MTPTTEKSTLLENELQEGLISHLMSAVKPEANRLDHDSPALFNAFYALGKRGWLIPKAPERWQGLGLSGLDYQQFQQTIARYSGALAFLQTQHQSAASLLLASDNEALQQRYLPGMAIGAQRLGVGFSQLRRRPAPLTARAVAGGYRLNGQVPWVTGAGLFTDFVGAAVLPNGRAVFGILPLASQLVSQSTAGGCLRVDAPMALAGMSATNTVSVALKDWFLGAAAVVGTRPAGWLEQRDRANPLSPLGLIFGCTEAGIDVLNAALVRRQIDHAIAPQLMLKLAKLQRELPRVLALPEDAFAEKMALRGQAIALMQTSTMAATVATSGAANAIAHPAQRVYRESLVFSVSGQTSAGAIATLDSLLTSL
ncbi:MAG: acyl-CoA dehydrogenase family protein [Phormidesmis sp.]